jgi:ABC-type multidrug transport system fused ATPase/permease subunit
MASPQAATAVAFGLGWFLPIGNVFRSLIIGLNIAGEGCANGNVKSSSSMDSYSGPIFYLFLQVVALATISVWLEGGLAIFSRKIPLPRSTDVEMHQRYVPGGDVETETLRTEREDADMLRVLHVTKSFKSNVALNDVSFGLPAGEVLALIGPNGAGKSTLINIIQSELAATTGDVMLCADNSRKRSARKYLGGKSTATHLTIFRSYANTSQFALNTTHLIC